MKPECETISKSILECDGEFSPAIETHCRECASCRALMEDWRLLRAMPLSEAAVPETLDEKIIDAASLNFRKRHYRLWLRRAAIFAAAASILIGGITLFPVPGYFSPPAIQPQPELAAGWNWDAFEKWLFESDNSLLIGKELTAIESNGDLNPDFYFSYDFLFLR